MSQLQMTFLRQLGRDEHDLDLPRGLDVVSGSVVVDETMPLEALTREAYGRILSEVAGSEFPHVVRFWNYVGDINADDDGRERYHHFCAGRHDAFNAAGYGDALLPAGSAVGFRGRGLGVYYLAAREPGSHIENPRQISAYRYPVQYGPKSPSFSRATMFGDLLFVSGTASIVGHETVHAGDLDKQLDETLRNIEVVIGRGIDGGLSRVISARTYVRHVSDFERIARRLERVFANNVYLEADICRRDLLLEIEAIAR